MDDRSTAFFAFGAYNSHPRARGTVLRLRALCPKQDEALVRVLLEDERVSKALKQRGLTLGPPAKLLVAEGRESLLSKIPSTYDHGKEQLEREERERERECGEAAVGQSHRATHGRTHDHSERRLEPHAPSRITNLGELTPERAAELVAPRACFTDQVEAVPLDVLPNETRQMIVSVTHDSQRKVACAIRVEQVSASSEREFLGALTVVFFPPREGRDNAC